MTHEEDIHEEDIHEEDIHEEDAHEQVDSDLDPESAEVEDRQGVSLAAEDLALEEGEDFALEDEEPDPIREAIRERLRNMRLEARIEAVIFASQKPLKDHEILGILDDEDLSLEHVQQTLGELVEHYENRFGGFRLMYIKRLGYQFQTAVEAGPIMERMFSSRPRPISRAALETLAIIAYRQPVTRAEVEFIRGVDAGSIFRTLMERDLIKCTGRKEVAGRPMLFATTDEFLKIFNIPSLKDLPPLEAFQPNPETMKGAKERLEGDDAVDIEKYIADNTQEASLDGDDDREGDEDGDEEALAAAAEETAEDLEDGEEALAASEESSGPLQGASAGGDAGFDEDYREVVTGLADQELSEDGEDRSFGATSRNVSTGNAPEGLEDPTDEEEFQAITGGVRDPDIEFN